MIECYLCGEMFEPSPEKIKAWAESGRDFDPTDWECGQCDEDPDQPDGLGYPGCEISVF